MNTIILGGGCFWCTEAVFQRLKGVISVESGYAGGHIKNPAYREICTGTTGHAEVLKIEFDPEIISLRELLQVFFTSHDPTTLNRQGADAGTQYRSVIFYQDEAQKETALEVINGFAKQLWADPIVTELSSLPPYYPAEANHQNYYNTHQAQPYCQLVINPKVAKLKSSFAHLLK